MGEYEDTLKEIEEALGIVPDFMRALLPDDLVREWPVIKKYWLGESKIPGKYREMIGLAVAAHMKCPYCQLFHRNIAKFFGASDEELAETAMVSSITARWSNIIHAQHYDYQKFRAELERVTEHLTKLKAG